MLSVFEFYSFSHPFNFTRVVSHCSFNLSWRTEHCITSELLSFKASF